MRFLFRIRSLGIVLACTVAAAASARAADGPSLAYSTFIGGSQDEPSAQVVYRSTGDLVVVGRTASSDFPTTTGPALSGGYDLWIAALDPDPLLPPAQQLLWSRLLGGSGTEFVGAAGVDAAGNVYVAGYTGSNDFPTTDQTSGPGLYALSISADGSSVRYSTVVGPSSGNTPEDGGLAVAADGKVWLTGTTSDASFPVTTGPAHAAGSDVVVAALDAGGKLLWSRFVGGDGDDFGFGLAVGADGKVRITGQTESSDLPTPGGYQTTLAGTSDAFLVELGADGGIIYGSYLGGTEGNGPGDREKGLDVAVGPDGSTWLTGRAGSSDFPTSATAFSDTNAMNDAFLAVFDTAQSGAASLVYSTLLGGSDNERGVALRVDSHGIGYVFGRTLSDDLPVTADALYATAQGRHDTFLAVLDPSRAGSAGLLHLTYLGGSRDDAPGGIALCEAADNLVVYLAGDSTGNGFPTTIGSYSPTYNGGSNDSFVTAIAGLDTLIFRDGFELGNSSACPAVAL